MPSKKAWRTAFCPSSEETPFTTSDSIADGDSLCKAKNERMISKIMIPIERPIDILLAFPSFFT